MAIIMDSEDNLDWSISAAAEHLEILQSDLHRMGIEGKLTLSIRKPTNVNVFIILARKNKYKQQYERDAQLHPNRSLCSQAVKAHLLNLSPMDCKHLERTVIHKCVFDSIYEIYDPDICGEVNFLEYRKSYNKNWLGFCYGAVYTDETRTYIGSLGISNYKRDAINFSQFSFMSHQFGIFNKDAVPLKRFDLTLLEEIEVKVDDLCIANPELIRFKNIYFENRGDNKSYFMGEVEENEDWTSPLLHLLNSTARRSYGKNLYEVPESDYLYKVKSNTLKNLIDNGVIKSDENDYFKYFCYLSSSDDCFFNKKALANIIHSFNKKVGLEIPRNIPSVLYVLNWYAKNFGYNSDKKNYMKKEFIIDDLVKDFKFTYPMAQHAARTIVNTPRARNSKAQNR